MKLQKAPKWMFNVKILTILLAVLIIISEVSQVIGDPVDPSRVPLPIMPYDRSNIKYNNNPHQSPEKFKQYIKTKYKLSDDAKYIESTVKQTANGLSGDFWISVKLVPHKNWSIHLSAESADSRAKARAIAKAFIEDETGLFDITNPNELREINIVTRKGIGYEYTIVYFRKYVNDIELRSSEIQITITDDGQISGVSANLVPVAPEVYEATKKQTLSIEEIKSIIEADIPDEIKRRYDINYGMQSFKKRAITRPPYVIWEGHFRYDYTIDAFTGKIITKINRNAPPRYPTPNDKNKVILPPPPPAQTTPEEKSKEGVIPPPLPMNQ